MPYFLCTHWLLISKQTHVRMQKLLLSSPIHNIHATMNEPGISYMANFFSSIFVWWMCSLAPNELHFFVPLSMLRQTFWTAKTTEHKNYQKKQSHDYRYITAIKWLKLNMAWHCTFYHGKPLKFIFQYYVNDRWTTFYIVIYKYIIFCMRLHIDWNSHISVIAWNKSNIRREKKRREKEKGDRVPIKKNAEWKKENGSEIDINGASQTTVYGRVYQSNCLYIFLIDLSIASIDDDNADHKYTVNKIGMIRIQLIIQHSYYFWWWIGASGTFGRFITCITFIHNSMNRIQSFFRMVYLCFMWKVFI